MSGEFALSGEIDPKGFPFAIIDLHRQGATGSLRVEGPTYHKALYFRAGRVLFGSSNDPRDQLGAILIESGKLTPEQLEDVNSKVGPGNPLAKLLAESGLVSQRELGEAARSKVERILSDLLTYDSGSYEFEDGVLPKGAVDLKLSTQQLAIAAARRVQERAFVLRHIESLQTVLSPTPQLSERGPELEGELGVLPHLIDGQRTLKDLASESGIEEFETAKIACALLFLGWVRGGPMAPAEAPGPGESAGVVAEPDAGPEIDLGQAADAGIAMSGPDAEGAGEPEPQIHFGGDDDDTVAIPTPSFDADDEQPPPEGHGAFIPEPEVMPEPDDAGEDWSPPAADMAGGPADEELAPQSLPSVDASGGEEYPPAGPPPGEQPYDEPGPPDTLPAGDAYEEPAPTEPPPFDPPPTHEPAGGPEAATEIGMAASSAPTYVGTDTRPKQARPSKEDLAALDALLNARTAEGPLEPLDRSEQSDEEWKPQFLSSSSPSGGAVAGRSSRRQPERTVSGPLLLLAGFVVVGGAMVFGTYLMGGPRSVYERVQGMFAGSGDPVAAAPSTTAPAPPTTLEMPPDPVTDGDGVAAAAAPAEVGSGEPVAPPVPGPGSTATATPGQAAPAQVATPEPASPAPTTSAAPAGTDARAALRAGRFDDAARAFAGELRGGAPFTLQVLVACARETVEKAVTSADAPELYVLPVTLQGRSCFRICWGRYDSEQAARSGTERVPAYFRQNGAKPRVARIAELLP